MTTADAGHHFGRSSLLALALTCAAHSAQAKDAADSTAAKAPELEQIVVTAQRREERLQSVPVSVSALTAEAIAERGGVQLSDMAELVPNLEVGNAVVSGPAFLRGVGSDSTNLGAESPVALYIDGVYHPSGLATVMSFNNIARVEVLKGPQGTLFGRNATGGVIQVITRDPSATPSADLSLSYGSYQTIDANFYGTVGITDKLAADLAVYEHDQGRGWGHNLTTHQDTFKDKDLALRNKWRLDLGDTQATLSLAYDTASGDTGTNNVPVPGTRILVSGESFAGFYNVFNAEPVPFYKRTLADAALDVTHDFGWSRLRSITSFQSIRDHYDVSQENSSLLLTSARGRENERVATQELQLLSPTDSKVQWIGGLFFFKSTSDLEPLELFGNAIPLPFLDISSRQTITSYAAFGQATMPLGADTNLTLGARYTSDKDDYSGRLSTVSFIPPGPTPGSFNGPPRVASAKNSKPTWRISLDHEFTPDVMGYASYSRGFKSGLFSAAAVTDPPALPETLDAYEAGVKSEWLQHRLRLNASAFYYDYANIQVQQVVGTSISVFNGTSATIKGLEFEALALPTPELQISASIGLLDGKYGDFPNVPAFAPVLTPPYGNAPIPNFNARGQRTIRTPPVTANLGVLYTVPFVTSGSLIASVSLSHNGGFNWDAAGTLRQPKYNLLNAALIWTSPSGLWGATLWGKNLTKAEYLVNAHADQTASLQLPAAPRTVGVTLTRHLK